MFTNKKIKIVTCAFFFFLVFAGTFNAIVINSDSKILGTDVKFIKRLDEIYGVTVTGRVVANTMSWKKIAPQNAIAKQVQTTPQFYYPDQNKKNNSPAVEELIPVAAVQEELTLSLVEVINPKKWQKSLTTAQFEGALSTNNGVIENLTVNLPNEESVSVSFSEMSGNVFEYDMGGELYSGMMYQVDQNSYMVTLTNGPLEGTRMRFAGDVSKPDDVQAETLAYDDNSVNLIEENAINSSNLVDGNINQEDQQMQQEALEAQNLQQNTPETL